jgi:hypothetical protein
MAAAVQVTRKPCNVTLIEAAESTSIGRDGVTFLALFLGAI